MLKLRDIMTRELVTFAPDMSLREAADVLLERHLSAAPVVAGSELLGVISMPDILGFVASAAPAAPDTRVAPVDWASEVEEPAEKDADEDEEAHEWAAGLWTRTEDELVERFRADQDDAPQDLFGRYTVADAMTRGARTLPPDAGVDEAAEMMRRETIHRVLVVDDDGRLLGLVSALDIARAVAEHKLLVNRYVFDRHR